MPEARGLVQSGGSDGCRLALWQSNILYYFAIRALSGRNAVGGRRVVAGRSLLATTQTHGRTDRQQPNNNNVSL